MRFEFVEALLRTAVAKYLTPAGAAVDASAKRGGGSGRASPALGGTRPSSAAAAELGKGVKPAASKVAKPGAGAPHPPPIEVPTVDMAAISEDAGGPPTASATGPPSAAWAKARDRALTPSSRSLTPLPAGPGPGTPTPGGGGGLVSAWEPVVDLVGAVRRLLDECIIPRVAPGALVDPDEFREMRLYTQDVDELYDKHAALLKAIYGHYKDLARDSGAAGWLDLPEWLELLGEGRLYHSHFTVREARLAFVWSRMRYYDELSGGRATLARAKALSFVEFLEALGRTADLISPPPPEELDRLGFRGAHATYDYFEAVRVDPGLLQPDRASSGFHAPKSRRLAAKLEQVLDVMYCGLRDLFGANTPEQLIAKLKQPRPRGYKIKKGGG
ncbi:hypothetical protein HXX76_015105 [Chlamydomonas incerta]|uniref:Flagellar associated protein n=1 Tax=Chlamydomonas incerta TaxID=51695 RepID=A0A835VQ73_CHLIN|nr:hypothetical protein HXX76_015105 [Chlamydomonas incerta]|eukprot:KAG2423715.1 hypothetical protein HXX76_015105 [Chlamydomonas incerta]